MKVELVPAQAWHGVEMLRNLRGDQPEVVSSDPEMLEELQHKMLVSSHCNTGLVDGKVAVIWGVIRPSLIDTHGILWSVASKLVDEHPFLFARYSKMELQKILEDFSILYGYVNLEYRRSARWLRWLGFELGAPIEYNGHKARVVQIKGAL